MNIAQLQRLIGVKDDGRFGPVSRNALLAHFTNRNAPALDEADIIAVAARLGCSPAQVKAVRKVEAAGSGFDATGKPKILFERHRFHKLTSGAFSISPFSNPKAGGYELSSWAKLLDAIATGEVDAAFQAASWGAFQVMGEWYDEFGFDSPYALAKQCVGSEAGQMELLVRYVEHFRLQDEIRALTSNPVTCRAFAAAYNGPGYRRNKYDEKLAKEMSW